MDQCLTQAPGKQVHNLRKNVHALSYLTPSLRTKPSNPFHQWSIIHRRKIYNCCVAMAGQNLESHQQHSHRPYVLGLTGSVGMGKSTVAGMFDALGVPVLDADKTVHQMYQPGGAAVPEVQKLFPEAVVNGGVDRGILGKCVLNNKEALAALEAAVHPLVSQAREQFLQQQTAARQPLVVFDIPLLFEKNLQSEVDAVVVVSARSEDQTARVLARGWTQEKLNAVLALQVPDHEKRARADYVIDTSTALQETEQAVRALVTKLMSVKPPADL